MAVSGNFTFLFKSGIKRSEIVTVFCAFQLNCSLIFHHVCNALYQLARQQWKKFNKKVSCELCKYMDPSRIAKGQHIIYFLFVYIEFDCIKFPFRVSSIVLAIDMQFQFNMIFFLSLSPFSRIHEFIAGINDAAWYLMSGQSNKEFGEPEEQKPFRHVRGAFCRAVFLQVVNTVSHFMQIYK